MGDTSHEPGAGLGPPRHHQLQHQQTHDSIRVPGPKPSAPLPGPRPSSAGAPFYSQYSTIPQPQQRLDPLMLHQNANLYAQSGSQHQPGLAFNMTGMAGALPEYASHTTQQSSPPRISGASTPAVVYQLQQNLQFSPQGPSQYLNQSGYGNFAPTQYAGYNQPQNPGGPSYNQYAVSQARMGAMTHPHFAQYAQQYYYYPGAMPISGQPSPSFPSQQGHYQQAYPSVSHQSTSTEYDARTMSGYDPHGGPLSSSHGRLDVSQVTGRRPSDGSLSAIPRGPPRKPKQSGHAMWVGNLPPGARVLDLKDHFSRDATRDIESVFLISKSNCAFVNYRNETACGAALQRFHDSRFQGVRLVCRLRRSSATNASNAPITPSAMVGRRTSTASFKSPLVDGLGDAFGEAAEGEEQGVEEQSDKQEPNAGLEKVNEKFFIVKSLTLQDLEQSVLNGVWATQSHNEEALNKAFEAAENVYLVFSANKSGEYFGYARMLSPISADVAEIYQTIPQPEPVQSSDAPKTITTPATEFAPRGRIIDDSARGTIFWEAELSDTDEEEEESKSGDELLDRAAQAWGKPFKVEWMSTNRLPFYRTRGLRNPWNANREVKIARDGTELETGLGRRLIQMFHRPGPVGPNTAVLQHMAFA